MKRSIPVRQIQHSRDSHYQKRMEKSLIISLILIILLFSFSKKAPRDRFNDISIDNTEMIAMDIPPKTAKKSRISSIPDKPVIPMTSESEFLPSEIIPDSTSHTGKTLSLWDDLSATDVIPDFDQEGGYIYRQNEDVGNYETGFVELNILVNREGRVDSVTVRENTTHNQILARKAMLKAYRSWFLLQWKGYKQEKRWIQRTYWFTKVENRKDK